MITGQFAEWLRKRPNTLLEGAVYDYAAAYPTKRIVGTSFLYPSKTVCLTPDNWDGETIEVDMNTYPSWQEITKDIDY